MLYKSLFVVKKPFIWGIVIAISLAYAHPALGAKGGLLKPEITVKYGAVFLIFFVSGISLQNQEIAAAACQYHLHILIQGFSLLFTPLLVQILLLLLGDLFYEPDLLKGFITVSCMPPPVSSAVILTKAVGGNEAAAVFNSAFGSFLGIFVTPALLFIFLGSSTSVPVLSAVFQLCLTVVFPVILGQYSRLWLGNVVQRYKKLLSSFGSLMLLLIIYATFCETFVQNNSVFTFSTVFATVMLVLFMQSLLMAIVFRVTAHLQQMFTPEDTVAAVFCATHKSLTLGFPLLKILYGDDPKFLLITFPLLVYHPSQILFGSVLISVLNEWMVGKARRRRRTKIALHPV